MYKPISSIVGVAESRALGTVSGETPLRMMAAATLDALEEAGLSSPGGRRSVHGGHADLVAGDGPGRLPGHPTPTRQLHRRRRQLLRVPCRRRRGSSCCWPVYDCGDHLRQHPTTGSQQAPASERGAVVHVPQRLRTVGWVAVAGHRGLRPGCRPLHVRVRSGPWNSWLRWQWRLGSGRGSTPRHSDMASRSPWRDVLSSPLIADPLHTRDCCLITDGGGAVVMTTHRASKGSPADTRLGHRGGRDRQSWEHLHLPWTSSIPVPGVSSAQQPSPWPG